MTIRVTVVFSPAARKVSEVTLELERGATVEHALQSSGLLERFPEIRAGRLEVGVWGAIAAPHRVLHDRDRVEIYRALKVDPKVARRERFAKQGARSACKKGTVKKLIKYSRT